MANDYVFPNYTSNLPKMSDIDWISNTNFRYSGFNLIHEAANSSLHGIFPNFDEFSGFRLTPDDLLEFNEKNFNTNKIIRENTGPLTFAVIGLLLALVLTVVGIIWCIGKCCTCCGCLRGKKNVGSWEYVENRFGGQTPEQVKHMRKTRARKIRCGGFVIFSLIFYLAFLIGLFITNNQLHNSIAETTKEFDNYQVDGQKYIDVTQRQFDAVMKTSYTNLSVKLNEVGECHIIGNLEDPVAKNSRLSIRVKVLTPTKIALSQLIQNVRELDDYQKHNLQDEDLSVLTLLMSKTQSIQENVGRIEHALSSQSGILTLCQTIIDVGTELATEANELSSALDYIPVTETRQDIKEVEKVIEAARQSIFHSVNGLNIFLLVQFVLVLLGVILSFFPLIKRFGSFSINCGLFTIFITVLLIWTIAVSVFFFAGGLIVVVPGAFNNIAENGSLVNPDQSKLIQQEYKLPNVPHILQTCKNHDSAYNVFKLDQVYNVEELDKLNDRFLSGGMIDEVGFMRNVLDDITNMKIQIFRNMEKESEIRLKKLEHISTLLLNLEGEVRSLLAKPSLLVDMVEVRAQVSNYVEFAKTQISKNVGNCEPLYDIFDSILHVFTYKMGSPIGAYWFSLNLMMFLLYPIVITAIIFLSI